MPPVMSKLTFWFLATAPSVERTAGSMTGWLLKLVVVSPHAQLATLWMRPPEMLLALVMFRTRRFRRAWVTVLAPTPLTWMRRNVRCIAGPASALITVLVPRLVVGVSDATFTSAVTEPVTGPVGAGGAGTH